MHMAKQLDGIEDAVREVMSEYHVPGLSIAIVHGGDINAKSYGYAKLPDTKCTLDTLFDCASTSKSLTAAAVALLVDDDKYPSVQWRSPVSEVLPDDFVLQDPHLTANVTIEDILCHRTGIPGHDDSYLGVLAKQPDNPRSMTRNLRNLPSNEPLRTKWQYSNIMFTVASYLVETVSGLSFPEFLKQKFFEPLHMSGTYYDLPEVDAGNARDRMADGHYWQKGKEQYKSINLPPSPEGQGAGCILSSARSFALWIRSLLKQCPPLSTDAYRELVTPRAIIPIRDDDEPWPFYSHPLYALGLQTESYRGYSVIGHDGSVPGFISKVIFLPKLDWGCVIFANSDSAYYAVCHITQLLMDNLLEVPTSERIDWAAYWRGHIEKGQNEHEEEEASDRWKPPKDAKPLPVPLSRIIGEYHNLGYRTLVIDLKDGDLIADCSDRCFPFILEFQHLSGEGFAVEFRSTQVGYTRKMKAAIRVDAEDHVNAVGIALEEDMEQDLIWFERV